MKNKNKSKEKLAWILLGIGVVAIILGIIGILLFF